MVSFHDTEGLQHSVEVAASSLYEAVALAIAEFRRAKLIDSAPRTMSELEVTVRRPAESHRIRVQRFEQWLSSGSKSPAEQALKVRLRDVLSGRG